MKHTFNPNKFNVFTIVPDEFDRNKRTTFKEKTINTCIDSWEKIPNTDIHIFTTQDIKDTFPGMVENDNFYKKSIIPQQVKILKSDLTTDFTYPIDSNPGKESCFSTDELRYKLAKAIPNSIYMDSDIYIHDPIKLFENLNKYDNYVFCLTAGFKIKNTKLLDEIIDVYENKLDDFLYFDTTVVFLIGKQYIDFKKYNIIFSETLLENTTVLSLTDVSWHLHDFKLLNTDTLYWKNEVHVHNVNVINRFKNRIMNCSVIQESYNCYYYNNENDLKNKATCEENDMIILITPESSVDLFKKRPYLSKLKNCIFLNQIINNANVNINLISTIKFLSDKIFDIKIEITDFIKVKNNE